MNNYMEACYKAWQRWASACEEKQRKEEERLKVNDYNGQYLSPEPKKFNGSCSLLLSL